MDLKVKDIEMCSKVTEIKCNGVMINGVIKAMLQKKIENWDSVHVLLSGRNRGKRLLRAELHYSVTRRVFHTPQTLISTAILFNLFFLVIDIYPIF